MIEFYLFVHLLAGESVFMMGFWSGFNLVSLFIVSAGWSIDQVVS